MRVLRPSDRIKIKQKTDSGEYSVTIAPLDYAKKLELNAMTKMVGGKEMADFAKQLFYAVKYSVKEMSGLEDYDGKAMVLEFEGENLTDDAADIVLEALSSIELIPIVHSAVNRDLKKLQESGVSVEIQAKK